MGYVIYQTEGVILDKVDFGEADRLFYILTERFGLIQATAPGVRHLKSKLRYSLGLFSKTNICMIRARDYWRIVDSEETGMIQKNSQVNSFLFRVGSFLVRMLKGEEKNNFIWKELVGLLQLVDGGDLSKKDLDKLEILTAAKILNNLGYVEADAFENKPFNQKHLVALVDRAIKESML